MSRTIFISNLTRSITSLAILSSLVFLLSLAPTVSSISASDSRVLTVLNQTVDIDYGEKITISATVDAGPNPQNIEAVRTLFRARGGSTIWSYSYPSYTVGANGSNDINVTFDILTGPGSYYPPGAEFDIEIEVTDLNGDRTSVVSPEPIEYLDPAHNWERVSGNGYTVVYYGVDRSKVEDLVATIDHRIPTLEATLGVTDTPNFKAVVFPSIQSATPSFPAVSQTATDQFLFAGFAQPQYQLFVQGQINATTFTHELAHLYTHEAVSSSFLGGIPSWLDEGLARFLETGSSDSSNERLRSSVHPDELLSLNYMGTIPGKRSDVFIFYPQAGAFVGYLVEEYSHATMAGFLALLNKGRSVQDAFEIVYDKPLYEVENDWRAMFNADPLPAPVATVEPSESASEQEENTSVPLIDYASASAAGNQPSATSVPSQHPTSTPTTQPDFNPAIVTDDSEPDYLVASLVIGLSIIVGVWLFTLRRRAPSHKS